jgi:hypothetical protein
MADIDSAYHHTASHPMVYQANTGNHKHQDEYLRVTNEFNQQQKARKTLVLTAALYS